MNYNLLCHLHGMAKLIWDLVWDELKKEKKVRNADYIWNKLHVPLDLGIEL